jgi:hypothetical protein
MEMGKSQLGSHDLDWNIAQGNQPSGQRHGRKLFILEPAINSSASQQPDRYQGGVTSIPPNGYEEFAAESIFLRPALANQASNAMSLSLSVNNPTLRKIVRR